MPERKISTKLIITGEKEYRASMQNINRELKTLESQLKVVDSDFKGQANSLDALNAKNKALNDVLDKVKQKYEEEAKALEKAKNLRDQYAQAAEDAEKRLERLNSTTADNAEDQAKLEQEISKTKQELERYQAAATKAASAVENHTQKANAAKVQINDLGDEIAETQKYMAEAAASTDGCAKSIDEYGRQSKEAAQEAEEFGDRSTDALRQLAQALVSAGLVRGLKEIVDALKECCEASIEFESAMAGVAKTTDLTPTELDEMGQSLKELSTQMPMAADELAGITEAAGQLGIKKDDLVDFTKVMANLGTATNLSATEAASALAKFANIVGMAPENYERLGSVIVALGNNFATTEADIVEMSTRLAAAGELAGLTEAEIMALAAAMSSVGIEAEAGGTAMTQTLTAIGNAASSGGESLATMASVAKMSAAEFASTWKNEPVQAIAAFISGLGELQNEGGNANEVLESLGMSGVRQSNMLKSLASASGVMTDALAMANKEWQTNTALTKEAETRYATTESKLKMFQNAVKNLKTAIGDDLNPALSGLVESGTSAVQWATDFVEQNNFLVPAIAAVTSAVSVAGVAVAGLAMTQIPTLTTAFQTLGTVISTHPLFMIGTAVAAIVAGLATFISTIETMDEKLAAATEKANGLKDAFAASETTYQDTSNNIQATAAVAEGYLQRLRELEAQGLTTAAAQEEYARTVDMVNTLMPELNLSINEQTGLLEQNVDAILSQVEAWKQEALNEAVRRKYSEQLDAMADAQVELAENQLELNKATNERNEAEEKLARVTEERVEIDERLNELSQQAGELTEEEWEQVAQLSEQRDELLEKEEEYGKAVAEAQSQQNFYNLAVQDGQAIISEYDQQVQSVTESLAELEGETQSSAETSAVAFGSIEESANALAQSFYEAKEAAQANIESVIGLFQQMDLEATTSMENMLAALDSQIAYLDEFSQNMATAVEYGVDVGLLQQLSDGSEESAAILRGIVEDGGVHVAELNAKLAEVAEGKEHFSTEMAIMETNFAQNMTNIQQSYNEMVGNLSQYDEAAQAASQTVQGIIDAVGARESEVYEAFARLAAAGQQGYANAQQINSPSRVFYEYGDFTVQGAIDAVNDRERDMYNAFRDAAEMAQSGYQYAMTRMSGTFEQAAENIAAPAEQASQSMTILLNLDGEIIGQVVTPYVNGQLTANLKNATRRVR